MNEDVYPKPAKVLDTLPTGFPPTESGIEIKLFERVFEPEQAELFCDLKLIVETAGSIAQRKGRSQEGLEAVLTDMWERGQVFGVTSGPVRMFKMMPRASGLMSIPYRFLRDSLGSFCSRAPGFCVLLILGVVLSFPFASFSADKAAKPIVAGSPVLGCIEML